MRSEAGGARERRIWSSNRFVELNERAREGTKKARTETERTTERMGWPTEGKERREEEQEEEDPRGPAAVLRIPRDLQAIRVRVLRLCRMRVTEAKNKKQNEIKDPGQKRTEPRKITRPPKPVGEKNNQTE